MSPAPQFKRSPLNPLNKLERYALSNGAAWMFCRLASNFLNEQCTPNGLSHISGQAELENSSLSLYPHQRFQNCSLSKFWPISPWPVISLALRERLARE